MTGQSEPPRPPPRGDACASSTISAAVGFFLPFASRAFASEPFSAGYEPSSKSSEPKPRESPPNPPPAVPIPPVPALPPVPPYTDPGRIGQSVILPDVSPTAIAASPSRPSRSPPRSQRSLC